MRSRTYRSQADLKLLQEFNAAAIAVTNHCDYLHPGDILHHTFYLINLLQSKVLLVQFWQV